jgi:hypothetical protein
MTFQTGAAISSVDLSEWHFIILPQHQQRFEHDIGIPDESWFSLTINHEFI